MCLSRGGMRFVSTRSSRLPEPLEAGLQVKVRDGPNIRVRWESPQQRRSHPACRLFARRAIASRGTRILPPREQQILMILQQRDLFQ